MSTPLNITSRSPRRPDTANNNVSSSVTTANTQTQTPIPPGTPLQGIGTPDLRALRAQYAVTGTPPPNIPPRASPLVPGPLPSSQQQTRTGSPALGPSAALALEGSPIRPGVLHGLGLGIGGLSATRSGTATPTVRPSTPGLAGTASGTDTPQILDLDDLPDEEKLKVVRRHLVSRDERAKALSGGGSGSESDQNGNGNGNGNGASDSVSPNANAVASGSGNGSGSGSDAQLGLAPSADVEPSGSSSDAGPAHFKDNTFPIPYHAPGADVTHDIYKWHSEQQQRKRARAASYAGSSHPPHPAFEHIHEPGGFRRNYVLLRATEQGAEEMPRMLNNFIDFLFLYGHFAGEDLEEDEDEDKSEEDDEERISTYDAALSGPIPQSISDASETTPLISGNRDRGIGGSAMTTTRSRSRRRAASVAPHGNATVTQAVLMLLKSFIGTGVLFLGKAFMNGGLLFSTVTFVFIALISLYSFLLLIKTKFVVSGSFGDIGGTLYGPWMRYTILGSIIISQLGFVAAYTIFVAENLQAFVLGITNCQSLFSVQYFILLQLVVFLPLALVRDLTRLSTAVLVADGFIFTGLAYIFGSEIKLLATRGVAEGVKLFNPRDFPLFIGTAVFSFEGIGLVIPITDAMREPRKFPAVLTGVMLFLVVLFGGAGVLAYLTFGPEIQTVVLVNLDTTSKMVQSVQFVYALAILLSVPLQFFPAVRILENGLFTPRSGKANPKIKWLKNCFRFGLVMLCTAISWVGAKDLDKFVAFVGCFACVPLCYVYPAMLHYRACSRTWKQKAADWAMIVFGVIAALYTSIQTIKLMLEPDTSGPPIFGNCDIGHT